MKDLDVQLPQSAGLKLLSAVLLTSIVLAACTQAAPAPPPPPQVSVAEVLARDVVDWDEFTGRLEAVDSVEVRPRVTGYIERVNFVEGSEVKKGDLLFEIDRRPYQGEFDKAAAELARAQARAELGRSEVARGAKLLGAHALSQEEYDQRMNDAREAEASVHAAQAALDIARLNLGFTRITSPISGRTSKAEVTVGNLVSGGSAGATRLTTVVSLDPIYVSFEGDEQVYLKYTDQARSGERQSSRDASNPVQVGLANETGYPHQGHMVFVDNQLNPATGTIRARALLDNKERRFTPGLFARVKLLGSGSYRAILIDDRAIGTDQSERFVYVVDAQNTVSYRAVKLGRLVEGLRVVHAGLQPGERIVVNGLQRLRPGITIAAQRVSMLRNESNQRLAQAR